MKWYHYLLLVAKYGWYLIRLTIHLLKTNPDAARNILIATRTMQTELREIKERKIIDEGETVNAEKKNEQESDQR